VKTVRNVRLSDEAQNWIRRHYMEPDTDDPSRLLFLPTLTYSLETRDGAGKRIAGPRHIFGKQRTDRLAGYVISPFDYGRKFIAITFYPEEHNEDASYLVEYFDGVWYVLKE
jgi:hypothetical protein